MDESVLGPGQTANSVRLHLRPTSYRTRTSAENTDKYKPSQLTRSVAETAGRRQHDRSV